MKEDLYIDLLPYNSTMKKSFTSFRLHPGMYKDLPLSDACVVLFLTGVLCVQLFFLLSSLNDTFLHETIVRRGDINEGVIGVPVYRNPLYATNAAEKDIAALMHAGLLKYDAAGDLIPHLAQTWKQDSPGQYTFALKKNASFHDGSLITTADALYTIGMIQGQQKYITPLHEAWRDVAVEAVDDMTLTFTIPEGNLHFPEQFTTPILPKHVWKKIPADKQRSYAGSGVHIGAGPYKYGQETVTLDGRPTNIVLESFSGYVLGSPFIKTITLHFFVDAAGLLDSYEVGTIDSVYGIAGGEAAVLLEQREEEGVLHATHTNRVFGVFFNAEDGRLLQDSFLRSILSQWVKREHIITHVFNTYATPIQYPLPTDTEIQEQNITLGELQQTLEDIDWGFESATGYRERDGVPLTISFVIPDIKEAQHIADMLIAGWQRLGVSVTTKTVPEEEIVATIQEKDFDAILYGYAANTVKDLVALWKSGDRENLASITSFGSPTLNNLLTDLEQMTPPEHLAEQLSRIPDDKWQNVVYDAIKVEMTKNVPAIFLYSPHFLYILPQDIKRVGLQQGQNRIGRITDSSGRFVNVHKWYMQKEKVWKPFVEN